MFDNEYLTFVLDIKEFFNFTDSLVKKVKKKKGITKKKPFSGVLVSQMLAAREAEKQRIVEVCYCLFDLFFFYDSMIISDYCTTKGRT